MRCGRAFLFILFIFTGLTQAQATPTSMTRPDAPPLATRGNYAVGVQTLELTDTARSRTFIVEVWYPASSDEAILYNTVIGQTPVSISGQALRDTNPLEGPYPLIIASHGQPGTRFQFAYLSEHLASLGFVVASIDHRGSTYQDLSQQDYVSSIVYRPQDILFALDEIPKMISSADNSKVGLMGYSYGGYSVINAAGAGLDSKALSDYCLTATDKGPCFVLPFFASLEEVRGIEHVKPDPRIKAVFAMAPYGQPWLGKTSLSNLKVPLFIAVGENDDIATYARDANQYFRNAGSEYKYLLTLEAAQHNPFVECPLDVYSNWTDFERCSEPVWSHQRAHDITKHFASSFFSKFLQDDESTGEFLSEDLTGFKPRTTVGVKLETQ